MIASLLLAASVGFFLGSAAQERLLIARRSYVAKIRHFVPFRIAAIVFVIALTVKATQLWQFVEVQK